MSETPWEPSIYLIKTEANLSRTNLNKTGIISLWTIQMRFKRDIRTNRLSPSLKSRLIFICPLKSCSSSPMEMLLRAILKIPDNSHQLWMRLSYRLKTLLGRRKRRKKGMLKRINRVRRDIRITRKLLTFWNRSTRMLIEESRLRWILELSRLNQWNSLLNSLLKLISLRMNRKR